MYRKCDKEKLLIPGERFLGYIQNHKNTEAACLNPNPPATTPSQYHLPLNLIQALLPTYEWETNKLLLSWHDLLRIVIVIKISHEKI